MAVKNKTKGVREGLMTLPWYAVVDPDQFQKPLSKTLLNAALEAPSTGKCGARGHSPPLVLHCRIQTVTRG